MASTATSGLKGDQDQRTRQKSSGNRGFINNFAGGGSSLTPADINSPTNLLPGMLTLVSVSAVVLVGLYFARK